MKEPFKSGFVTIIGKPNVGKSTLINALLGQKLCITTPKAQTTRHRIFGIMNAEGYQIVLVDTPGVIQPKYELHKRMMNSVHNAIVDADVIVLLVSCDEQFDEQDLKPVLNQTLVPILLAVNKADIIAPEQYEQKVEQMKAIFNLKEAIAISAKLKSNLDLLIQRVLAYLPESPPYFDPEQITDRPERFFIAELIREQIFYQLSQELPYACEVQILQFKDEGKTLRIEAEIHVERQSQKAIVIGKNGNMLTQIGKEARKSIEEFVDKPVYLHLYVKVSENWKERPLFLNSFGYHEK